MMGRVYVAPVSFGLGDLVVSLPAVQALVDDTRGSTDEVWLVTRSQSQARLAERIGGLAGCVAEDVFDRDRADGRFLDLRDHPLQRDYWWGSPEFESTFGKLSINDILARICADFGVDAAFDRPVPLLARSRPELRSSVVLVAETDSPSKCWPADRWAAVASGIGDLGLDARVVTRDDASSELDGVAIRPVPAPTPGDAVDVLTAAHAVVGVDTGLTHIAAQQGTPTVTISRPNAVFFRSWPHTRVVAGNPCEGVCVEAERARAHNARVDLRGFRFESRACPVGARCLDAVQPEHVLHALDQVLASR